MGIYVTRGLDPPRGQYFRPRETVRKFLTYSAASTAVEKVTIPGKAMNRPTVAISATKNGPIPLKNIGQRNIRAHTVDDKKSSGPIGGVTRQISAILTTMMPNQIGS
ncbi:MAG: hypothetical protein CM1200mP20_12300 [Pseudomonadota bacterium]|nr:MAG: hypothetical protein CM1200mP20_12300 [Pseudomonadota bacterium]